MKKILSLLLACCALFAVANSHKAFADSKKTAPKASVSPALRPIIKKYKAENYVGALLDLEDLVKKEKNNTLAKYYLALCYTKLGYKNDAKAVYSEVVAKGNDLTLSQYSKKALICLDSPMEEICKGPTSAIDIDNSEVDDITRFIRSGQKIHPAAMDMITKERMERRIQEEEYIQRQQQELQDFDNPKPDNQAMAPTTKEIAQALNTLSKAGINPYNQTADLANLINQPMDMNNPNYLYSMLDENTNPDIKKMFLYNQMTAQSNWMNLGL